MAANYQVVPIGADGLYPRHVDGDLLWRDDLLAGDVLIATKNSTRFDPTDPQVVLTVTANVPVNVITYTSSIYPWLDPNGFPHNGTGTSYETPTPANPTSSTHFSIRIKPIGLSGTATLGPNLPPRFPCGAVPENDCNPMYWVVVRRDDRSVF